MTAVGLCAKCQTVERVAITGDEAIMLLQQAPAIVRTRKLRLSLGPDLSADVMGFRWGNGAIDGWWLAADLGTIRMRGVDV